MKTIFHILAFLGISIICTACHKTPDSVLIDGILVQAETNIQTEHQNESEHLLNDECAPLKKDIIYSEDAQLHIYLTRDNISPKQEVKQGTLKLKTYSKEYIQQCFCPDASLQEIEFGDGIRCFVEYEDENASIWHQYITISSAPTVGFSYTYVPLDKQHSSYIDRMVYNDEHMKAQLKQAEEYLSLLGTNLKIDDVIYYGDTHGGYYYFQLNLLYDGIRFFNQHSNNISFGTIQISENGLGDINIQNDFDVEASEEVDILSAQSIMQALENHVAAKLITPSGNINISSLELEYIIKDIQGQYTLYPVWCFNFNDGTGQSTYVALNAQNGEVEYYIGQ